MKLSRRELLVSSAALLGAPGRALSQASDAKHLIVVFAEGGWDVTFCFDPKLGCSGCSIEGPEVDELPDQPQDREAVQTFGQIPLVVNEFKRPSTRYFFERWHSRAHVINGIWTGSIAHDPCRYRILTGTPSGTSPDLASIVGAIHGGSLPLGAIDLSGWGIAGPLAASSGRIGHQSQLAALLDGGASFRAPPSSPSYPIFRADPADEALVDEFLAAREAQLRARFSDGGANDRRLDDLLESAERARRFRAQSDEALQFLTVGEQANFTQQIRMAVDLISAGVCHAVTLDTRDDWDTHDGNAQQHVYWNRLFEGLGELMRELEQRGLLEDTVVAVLSEMTRTPLRNSATGKDHWGHTSALLLGAVRGDAVSGGTDHLLESRPIDLTTGELHDGGELNKYDNLVAGILELVGVDPGDWLPGVTPFRGAHVG